MSLVASEPIVAARLHAQAALDVAALSDALALSFGFEPSAAARWAARAGLHNWRRIAVDGEDAAWLLALDAGLHLGGRRVDGTGIAAVCSLPERRGEGAAGRLLTRTLRELFDSGRPIAILHPVMTDLYRRVGFEPAGHRWHASARLADLRGATPAGAMRVRPITERDTPAVRAIYASRAAAQPGALARSDYLWGRLQTARSETRRGDLAPRGYLLVGDEGPEGYIYVAQKPNGASRFDLRVTDVVVHTARAARRAADLLGSHATFGDEVHLWTGPGDPFLASLPESPFRVETCKPWMVRIVDLARALGERGYPRCLDLEIHVDVRDELLPENAGRWTLRIADGRGHAERGGHGRVTMDIRGLAAMYTGYTSADALRVAGLLDGDAEEAARATTARCSRYRTRHRDGAGRARHTVGDPARAGGPGPRRRAVRATARCLTGGRLGMRSERQRVRHVGLSSGATRSMPHEIQPACSATRAGDAALRYPPAMEPRGDIRRFRVARRAVTRMGSVMIVFAALVAAWMVLGALLVGWLHLPPIVLAAGLGAMVVPLLVFLNLPGYVDLGKDGMLVDLRGPKRFVRFDDIEDARIFRQRSGGKTFVSVKVDLTSSAPLEVPLGEDQFGASDRADELAAAITSAVEASAKAGDGAYAAALERGDSTAAAWVARLRRMTASADAGPRDAPVPQDTLLRIVEDPRAAAVARASAAVALGAQLDPTARARVDAATSATAAPKLRIALEAAASADDEAIATALEDVEREANGAV